MDSPSVKSLIDNALNLLINNDKELIERRVKEECINHKLATYIESLLYNTNVINNTAYSIDIEYNKNFDHPKYIVGDNDAWISIRPDIVVHERNSNMNNLIVIEAKKNYPSKHDKRKIKALMSWPYSYDFAFLISYLPGKNYINIRMYSRNDNKIDDKKYQMDKKKDV